MLEFSEPITTAQDVWGWVEPDLFRNFYGYYRAFTGTSPNVARAVFDIVDDTTPAITSAKEVLISTRQSGGRTGGWNADKTKFAVIRTQGASATIRDFLTYVDTSDEDPTVWALAADIRELTTEGGDAAEQIRFVPPDGLSIARVRFRSARFVVDSVNINTGASTVLGYEDFFPTYVGNVYRYAYSPDGQWVAFTLDGTATGANGTFQGNSFVSSGGDGLFVFRRSDGELMYYDPTADNDETSYRLHHFPEDSTLFVYMSGTTVKKVSTQTWTVVASQAFASAPRPNWVSPGELFYTGGEVDTPGGRIWDAAFNVVYSGGLNGLVFDWNQEGTRAWGALPGATNKWTVSTPGYVATNVGFWDNEGDYRMRPWL